MCTLPILVGVTLSSFGDIATFKNGQISLSGAWTIVHGHQKIQLIGIGWKNSCKYGLMMSSACTPILVGVVFSAFGDTAASQKWPNFPFRGMGYSPWSSKNSINRNQLKKFMQVWTWCQVHAHNFGGCGFLVSEILLLSKTAKFPFWGLDYSPWSSKNLIDRNWLKNSCKYELMSSVYTPILVGVVSPISEILLPSKMAKFPFLTMDYSPWSSENSMDRNWLKKFMQVWTHDVKCVHANFGGCGLSAFRDIATFKNGQISLSTHGL